MAHFCYDMSFIFAQLCTTLNVKPPHPSVPRSRGRFGARPDHVIATVEPILAEDWEKPTQSNNTRGSSFAGGAESIASVASKRGALNWKTGG